MIFCCLEMTPVLHKCHLICSEMMHFVQQVQYYINFEVYMAFRPLCLSVCLLVCLSIVLCLYVCSCLSGLYLCFFVFLTSCFSVYLYICLFGLYISVCGYVCICLSACLLLSICVCLLKQLVDSLLLAKSLQFTAKIRI